MMARYVDIVMPVEPLAMSSLYGLLRLGRRDPLPSRPRVHRMSGLTLPLVLVCLLAIFTGGVVLDHRRERRRRRLAGPVVETKR